MAGWRDSAIPVQPQQTAPVSDWRKSAIPVASPEFSPNLSAKGIIPGWNGLKPPSSAFDQFNQAQQLQKSAYNENPMTSLGLIKSGRGVESPLVQSALASGSGVALNNPAIGEYSALQKVSEPVKQAVGMAVNNPVVNPVRNAAGGLLEWTGGKVASISPEAAGAYARAPQESEALYSQLHKNPIEFQKQAASDVEGGITAIGKNVVHPKVNDLNKTMIGKTFKVDPSDFEGTAAQQIIENAWNKQGKTVKVPVSDTDKYMTGQSYKEVPAPLPDKVTLTGPQMLEAKRETFKAAEFNAPRSGIGYSAAETAQAKKEAEAGVNLRSAMEKTSPEMAKLNDEIEEAIRYKSNLNRLGNPSQMYNASDSLGGTPNRALRQYVEQAGGPAMENKARQLEAAGALNKTSNSIDRGSAASTLIKQPIAKGLLKLSGLLRKGIK